MVHYIGVCNYLFHVLIADSEFYDDIMPVHHYDSEAPLVHSTPAIVVWTCIITS